MALPFPAIDPIALQIGPLAIRWYALAYLAGFILGWLYALRLTRLDEGRPGTPGLITRTAIDDFLPWAVAGVILGGRLGYVLFYQPAILLHAPLDVLKVWEGGMSFHGGALGVIVAMIIYAKRHGLALLRLTDIICAVVPIGLFFGRISNFINGELFGRVTDSPWGVVFPMGGPLPRHPSQLYEAVLEGLVLGLVLLVLITRHAVRNRPGIVSGVFLAGYGIARFIVEFFREADAHIGYMADIFTRGQLLCVPMILAGMYLVGYALLKGRKDGVAA